MISIIIIIISKKTVLTSIESVDRKIVSAEERIVLDGLRIPVFGKQTRFDLVRQKGVFPYDFLDDMSCFGHTKLPNRRLFFNRLTSTMCSLGDYFRAVKVWKKFDCRTFADFHDVYLKSDVTLLADVFEKFRASCMELIN